MEQRIFRVRWIRKRPFDAQIGAEADYDDAVSFLGHSVIGGVHRAVYDVVVKTLRHTLRVMPFQAAKVIRPIFVRLGHEFGVTQLQRNVFEVFREGFPEKPANVLDEHCLRLQFANGADHLGKHVAAIEWSFVFAADGKRLARWPSGEQVRVAGYGNIVKIAYVPREDFPALQGRVAVGLVLDEGGATIAIPFYDNVVVEAGAFDPKRQAASPGEKLYRSQAGSKKARSRRESLSGFFSWHSHTTITLQPDFRSRRMLARSRRWLPSSFAFQNSTLDLGNLVF